MNFNLRKLQKFYLFWKRLIDIFGSTLGIVLLSALVWWWVAILIKCTSKGPIFFKQYRVGKNAKAFKLIKFRSMRVDVDPNMTSETIGDTKKYTYKFGNFLRKTSIDETPQLLNIFVGHMSFIGPRPLIDKYPDSITIEERKENGAILLKPGISGLAQVSGRVNLPPAEKGKMDGEYFKKLSFHLDFVLFFRTIFKVFFRKDTTKDVKKANGGGAK